MRTVLVTGIALGVALLVGDTALAQRGGIGFQFGGFGGGADPATLLRLPQVAKELELSEEQLAKVPVAVMEALGKVLDEKQMKRLKQISLQQRGINALNEPDIQDALKMSAEQKETITVIFKDYQKDVRDMFENLQGGGGFGGGAGGEVFGKMQQLRKDMEKRVNDVLTADQRKQWEDMLGPEFQMQGPGFGGFGRGGRGGGGGGDGQPALRPRDR